MKKTFFLISLFLLSNLAYGQTKIRVSQIEDIQGTVIKSIGETASKVLTTNGSGSSTWQTPTVYAPLSGSTNYIQNQIASAQTANIRITGSGIFNNSSTTYGILDVTNNPIVRAGQIQSSVATGTAPLTISSTTLVSNLNADYLDGQHGSYYQKAYGAVSLTEGPHGQTRIETPTINNLLFSADDRFLVTTSGFSYVDTALLFDNNYDQYSAAQINTSNTTAVITINFVSKSLKFPTSERVDISRD